MDSFLIIRQFNFQAAIMCDNTKRHCASFLSQQLWCVNAVHQLTDKDGSLPLFQSRLTFLERYSRTISPKVEAVSNLFDKTQPRRFSGLFPSVENQGASGFMTSQMDVKSSCVK